MEILTFGRRELTTLINTITKIIYDTLIAVLP
jgi:hypothetical protein